jgi:GTP-binding protein Era
MTESAKGRETFRSGFIAIVGKPNVGKSTLLNRLLGRKIAPVSRKPQTTRENIRGIRTVRQHQLIFIDTPGLHEPHDGLGRHMVSSAKKSWVEADLMYLLVPALPPEPDDLKVIEATSRFKNPIFLLINKVDLLKDKRLLLPIIEVYQKLRSFEAIVPISALKGDNLGELEQLTIQYLPEGPKYFPDDMISDQPVQEIVKEFIREKVVRFTGEEIPYVTAVQVDDFKKRADGLTEIRATVFVEKDSQKGILIGKGGIKMKQIGEAARHDIELFLGKKVFLGLWVKVLKGWRKDPSSLRRLGYGR